MNILLLLLQVLGSSIVQERLLQPALQVSVTRVVQEQGEAVLQGAQGTASRVVQEQGGAALQGAQGAATRGLQEAGETITGEVIGSLPSVISQVLTVLTCPSAECPGRGQTAYHRCSRRAGQHSSG